MASEVAAASAASGSSSSKLIGFLLSITGNSLVACSYTLQKSAHNQLAIANVKTAASEGDVENTNPDGEKEKLLKPESRQHQSKSYLCCHPTWLLGIALMALGELGNFAALAFAPASLIAPLGAWGVVLSSILACLFLREHVSRSRLIGIVTCVSGAILIGTTGPDIGATEASLSTFAVVQLLQRRPFVIFIMCVFAAASVLMYLAHNTNLGHQYVFIYVGVSALLGAVTVVCAKALSTFVKLSLMGNFQFGSWISGVLILVLGCAIVLQLRYLNMGLARWSNVEVVPLYYVMFTMSAMTSSVLLYREFDQLQTRNIPFFIGVAATMSGVFVIHRGDRIWPSDKTKD